MKLRRSFRAKIALFVALICGGVLTTFGLTLWVHIRHTFHARLDRGLESIARQHAEFFRHHPERSPLPRSFFGDEFHELSIWAVDAEGRTVHRSSKWPADLTPAYLPVPGKQTTFRMVARNGKTWRVASVQDGPLRLYAAVDLSRFNEVLHGTRTVLLITLAAVLLIAALGGWWLSGRALRPVLEVTRAAELITASELSRRIPETAQDQEFVRLIQVLNQMLARLERSFEQAARFSVDASHELRTPLTIMQGEIESALSSVPADSPAERALTTQLDEIHRLKALVHRLLLLSKADRGAMLSSRAPLDLSETVRQATDDARALADGLTIEQSCPDGLQILGDARLIEQAVQNLLSNALKYNHPGGFVRVALSREGTDAVLRVTNSGPAIRPVDAERIFDRFYRADPARNRAIDGVGLGLSLAREIARSHGGELAFIKSQDGSNLFALRIPTEA